jgi:hypothetical protein
MKTTAADILIDTIYDWGVEVVFGLPGDGINGIVESLRKRADKIRFIQVCDEEAAAFSGCIHLDAPIADDAFGRLSRLFGTARIRFARVSRRHAMNVCELVLTKANLR